MDNRLRPESKKHIIRCAYKVLQRSGASDFSVRQVAHECGCSVSGLYRHFSSRDELMLYASLLYLEPYFKELSTLFDTSDNSMTHYFRVEEIFAKYSFTEPEIFYNLHFGMNELNFDRIFLDSFSLFENSPEEYFKFQFGQRFVGGGVGGRNLAMLELCHRDGFLNISREDLPIFNNGIINMYRGFLDCAIEMRKRGEDSACIAGEYLIVHRLMHQTILSDKACFLTE